MRNLLDSIGKLHRRPLMWLTLGLSVVAVPAVAGLAMHALRKRVERAHHAQIALARMLADASELETIEYEAIARGKLDADLLEQVKRERTDVSLAVNELIRLHPAQPQLRKIASDFQTYTLNTDEEFRLLTAGEIAAAEAYDEEKVDASFDVLHESIRDANQTFEKVSDRTVRVVDAGSVAVTLFACAAMGLLLWRLRAAELAVIEQESLRAANETLRNEVTARKEAEEALRELQRQQRALLDNIPDIAWLKDCEGRYVAVNQALAKAYGRKPKEIVGKTDFEMGTRELAERYRADDKQIMESRQRKRVEEPFADAAGNRTWVDTIKGPIINDQGKVIGTAGIARDITERKATEEALRQAHDELETRVRERTEQLTAANLALRVEIAERTRLESHQTRLAATLDAAPDFIGFADATDAHILYINKAGREMCGIGELEDVSNLKISDVHPGWVNKMLEEKLLPVAAREGVWRGECAFLHRDGHEIPVSMALLSHKSPDGEVEIFSTISRDVTERKRTEEALSRAYAELEMRVQERTEELAALNVSLRAEVDERKRTEESMLHLSQRNKLILSSADEGILGLDLQGNHTFVNPAAAEMLGYEPDELIGRPSHSTWHHTKTDGSPYPREECPIYAAFRDGTVHRVSTDVFWRKDGTSFPVEYASTPIREQGRPVGAVVTFADISERKQVEEESRQTNLRLRDALDGLKAAEQQVIQQERLRALGTMASGIAHDFNNVLASILGFTELLLHRPETLDDRPKALRYLQMMNTAALDAGNIVNRLREFYRHREDHDAFAPVNLNGLVEQAISLTQPKWKGQAQVKGITIDIRHEPDKAPDIFGNATDLREVLTNLILNAVDAMPNGGTITIRTRPDGDNVALEVADTGTGMTEEVRRRCLEPFFTTKGERGTGLGLAMVYGIVQRHEGIIDIQSELGKGTTFIIRLPHRRVQGQPAEPDQQKSARLARALRVLVVDDEPMVRDVVSEYLKGDGHAVEVAGNGHDGLEKFRADRFDLVLVDRAMPDISGDQVASIIKSVSPQTPVVMLTGFGSMMNAAAERPTGVDLIVNKPVTINALRKALAQVEPSPQGS